ncbi:MAG: hypothetical protein AAFN79_13345 [Pseudomonadota bacterium]
MKKLIPVIIAAFVLAVGAFALIGGPAAPTAARAMEYGEMTATDVVRDGFKVAPAMLAVVYRAFGETEEAKIYDTLAEVSAGSALEQLYLERLGAMAGGGLEPDQTIHEMELLNLSARANGDAVAMDAKWRVLGTVGHAEHMHVRGNAYSANLTIEPVEGAWRMTGFELRDVDRADAGGLQPREDNPHFTLETETPTE